MIYITHGVVSSWSSERISHALLLPEVPFATYLQHRSSKFVSVSQALAGHGDALTIDDATFGGLNAALLAREYGHEVSWLINGMNVERGLSYFPFQLSAMLDDTKKEERLFAGRLWNLRDMAGRRAFRLHLKQAYMQMNTVEAMNDFVESVSTCLEIDSRELEYALSTVTATELKQAVLAGVDLQNHSWSHLNPHALSEREHLEEVELNEDYLERFRVAGTRVFAPPFGRQVSLASSSVEVMLLADRKLFSGHRLGNAANRRDLLPDDLRVSLGGTLLQSDLTTTPAWATL